MVQLEITLSQAIDGFFLEKRAEQKSPHTISDYRNSLRKLTTYLDGDPLLNQITTHQITEFIELLGRRVVAPAGIAARPAKTLSKKSILNVHTALHALWTWATREGYADEHIMRRVPRPRPEQRAVVPYSKEDVVGMLEACAKTDTYTRPGKKACANSRPTALRDRAVILLLLDTGIRASELCDLMLSNLDQKNSRIKIFGKGSKERLLPFGKRTAKAIWRYLATRSDCLPSNPVFLSTNGYDDPLNRTVLRRLLRRLGDRVQVTPVANVHRFRHTFAINFLRNGGDAYTLKAMLGHSTLDMVQRYLMIAQADTDAAHKRASPVDNWKV